MSKKDSAAENVANQPQESEVIDAPTPEPLAPNLSVNQELLVLKAQLAQMQSMILAKNARKPARVKVFTHQATYRGVTAPGESAIDAAISAVEAAGDSLQIRFIPSFDGKGGVANWAICELDVRDVVLRSGLKTTGELLPSTVRKFTPFTLSETIQDPELGLKAGFEVPLYETAIKKMQNLEFSSEDQQKAWKQLGFSVKAL